VSDGGRVGVNKKHHLTIDTHVFFAAVPSPSSTIESIRGAGKGGYIERFADFLAFTAHQIDDVFPGKSRKFVI